MKKLYVLQVQEVKGVHILVTLSWPYNVFSLLINIQVLYMTIKNVLDLVIKQ